MARKPLFSTVLIIVAALPLVCAERAQQAAQGIVAAPGSPATESGGKTVTTSPGPRRKRRAGSREDKPQQPPVEADATKRWALIIGVGRYEDGLIPPIEFCLEDAHDLSQALRAKGYQVECLTEGEQKSVGIVRTAPERGAPPAPAETPAPPPVVQPTRAAIEERVQAFLSSKEIGPEDVVVVYFSGHGFAMGDSAYLAARDTRLQGEVGQESVDPETAIEVPWLRKAVEACPAKQKVLVLDSCHSGMPPQYKGKTAGAALAPAKPKLPGQEGAAQLIYNAAGATGMVTMASCRGSQSSWQKGQNSAFTAFMLDGLAGSADGNRDGRVGVTELNTYVHDKVTAWAKDLNVEGGQTPVFQTGGLEGDIFLGACPIPKKSGPGVGVIAGGAAAIGGLVAALGGGGGGGGGSSGPITGTVKGYVYRTAAGWRSPADSRQQGPRLLLRSTSTAPTGSTPAAGARVEARDSAGGSTVGQCGTNGAFSLILQPGKYDLTASLQSHQSVQATVTLGQGGEDVSPSDTGPNPVDAQPPTVQAQAMAPNSTTVDLVFDEAVKADTANATANYTIRGASGNQSPNLGVRGALLQTDGKTVRLTTDPQSGNVTYTVTVANVQDSAGNPVGTTNNTADFSGQAPHVQSVARVSATQARVTFSRPMDQASLRDTPSYNVTPPLALSNPMVESAAVVLLATAEQTSGVGYTLHVSEGIKDAQQNPMGPLNNSGSFVGAGIPPKVESARVLSAASAPGASVVEVEFSEAIDPTTAAAAGNYAITTTGGSAVSVGAAALEAGAPTKVRLSTAEHTGGKPYRVTVTNVADVAKNPVESANSADYQGVGAPPKVSAATAEGDTSVVITFDEEVEAASAGTAVYSLLRTQGQEGAPVTVPVRGAARFEPNKVRLTTGEHLNGAQYQAAVSNIEDAKGNPIATTNCTAFYAGMGTAPKLASAVCAAKDATNSTVTLTFSEPVDPASVGAAAYTITAGTGGAPVAATDKAADGSDASRVLLTTDEHTGGIGYTVAAAGVKDAVGNASVGTVTAPYAGVGTPPELASVTVVTNTLIDVLFGEPLASDSVAVVAGRYGITPDLQVVGAELRADAKTVRLTTAVQNVGVAYTVHVTGVTDLAKNAVSAAATPPSFNGFARIAFVSLGRICTMNADGTGLLVLTNPEIVWEGASAWDAGPTWSPDGNRIAFTSSRGTSQCIYSMKADGTDQVNLTSDAAVSAGPAWSPDGTRIAFSSYRLSNTDIYVMNADGTGVTRLTNDTGTDVGPTWSPDGTRIAFSSDRDRNYEIYVMDADGTGQERLTVNGNWDSAAAWSPDGSQIAFASDRNGRPAIYRMDANGSAQTPVTFGDFVDTLPAWLPDGSRLAFSRLSGDATGLYEVSPDGRDPTRLTDSTASGWDCDWSGGSDPPSAYSATAQAAPQIVRAAEGSTASITVTVRDGAYRPLPGASVGFTSSLGTIDASAVTDLSGQARATLVAGTTVGIAVVTARVAGERQPDATAAVSLVGPGQIAFSSERSGEFEIYAMDADGTGQTRLTDSEGWNREPAWSPDGSRIAFTSTRDLTMHIYAMNADGTGVSQLTSGSAQDWDPAWSPDGTRIAFVSNREGNVDIYTMNPDGSGVTRLTTDPALDEAPAWSPDGTQIAFASDRDGDWEIWVMKADGTGQVQRTVNSTHEVEPAWSPDETRIAFASYGGVADDLYVMNADGTGVTRIPSDTVWERHPTWSPDGSQIAFSASASSDIYLVRPDGTGFKRLTTAADGDVEPAWSRGTSPSGRAAGLRKTRAVVVRATSGGEVATAHLTAAGIEAVGASRAAGKLRFVAAKTGDGRRETGDRRALAARSRTWEFSVEAPSAEAEVTLSWPDIAGLGSKDRVFLEDLDTGKRRSMRTTASYVFRGTSRRFRVTAGPRTNMAPMLTGLELAGSRGAGARVVRFTLSTEATVEVELLSPSGRPLERLARAHAGVRGLNQVSWRGELAPGVYLLRATATTDDGTSVQALRPAVVVR